MHNARTPERQNAAAVGKHPCCSLEQQALTFHLLRSVSPASEDEEYDIKTTLRGEKAREPQISSTPHDRCSLRDWATRRYVAKGGLLVKSATRDTPEFHHPASLCDDCGACWLRPRSSRC